MKIAFPTPRQRDLLIGAAIVALLFLGLFLNNRFYLDILITSMYFSVIAAAWNIMCGFAGQLSLGHVAFLGVGQYTSVLLFTRLGVTPWVGVFAGGLTAMLLACFVGMLALRLKGPFFALATLALSTILQLLTIRFQNFTNGSSGITIPFQPRFANIIFVSPKPYYIIFIVLLMFVLLMTIYMRYSRLGSNLIAIRENDLAASTLGINLFKNKVIALMISALFTSIAGSLYAQYTLFIDPVNSFSPVVSQKAAILSIIGGAGTIFGPILGGLLLTPIEIMLRAWLGSTYQGAYLIIYGIILIFVILVIPNGVVGTVSQSFRSKKSQRIESRISASEDKSEEDDAAYNITDSVNRNEY